VSELENLPSRLASIESAPQFLTYDGRAVGRDKSHLHLAITSGVIAIPLDEIEEVTPLSDQPSDIVSVSVKSADNIKYIRYVSPMIPGGGFGGDDVLRQASASYSMTTGWIDSRTVTYGRLDATDHSRPFEKPDDEYV
jgi:hypothetical protein